MAAKPGPNLYELSGDGIHVTYTLDPIAGGPQLSYQDGHQSRLFKDKEIRSVDTEIGTLVTVTIQLLVDSGSTSFTILLPKVGLGRAESAPINTIGITTVRRFLIIGPPPQGQSEFYTEHAMHGTASFVLSLAAAKPAA